MHNRGLSLHDSASRSLEAVPRLVVENCFFLVGKIETSGFDCE
jgi:hypothetical protein